MRDLFMIGIGFVGGWIFFKRPQWATDALAWVKSKFGG
jgi:hypothetical protein